MSEQVSKRKRKRKPYNEYLMNLPTDLTVLFVVMFLVVFGIIMVYSSSFYTVRGAGLSEPYIKQMIFAVIGFTLMMIISRVQLVFMNKFAGLAYVVAVVLLVLVLYIGKIINGARRWIAIGGFNLQPSELTKIALILSLAFVLTKMKKHLAKPQVIFLLVAMLAPPIYLIQKQDLSSAVVVAIICAAMIFVAYRDTLRIFVYGGLFASLIGFFVYLNGMRGYRAGRISLFVDGPWSDPEGGGRQTIQALYAVGSGGLTGIGLGQSMQKMGYISEAHNDIIFAIICEELGLLGGIAIIALYGILLYRIAQIAITSNSMNHFLIAIGVMAHIGVQAFINVGVALALLPVTGMGLPFISYGGSSLIVFLMEIGLVLNISRHNKVEAHLGGDVYE